MGVINKYFLLILLFSSSLFAFSIYEDKTSSMTPREILNNTDKFYTPTQQSFSYSDSSFWLKFDFTKEKDSVSQKYILFNFAATNYVDMFYKANGALQEFNHGAGEAREFPFNEIILTVPLKDIDNKTVYVRVKHNGVLALENRVFDSRAELFELLTLRNDMTMLMVSTLILIIFFIAILAYSLKEITYRLYLLLLLFSMLMHLAINNSLTWLIGVENIDFVFQVGIDLTAVSLYLFIMNITQMKNTFPKIYKIFKLITTLTLYLLITEFFQNNDLHAIKTTYIVPLFLLTIFTSLAYMFYKKAKYSILISLGWLFLFTSTVVLYVSVHGIISNMYTPVIWKFFIIMEMLTFSLLLLYRIKELADDKLKSELVLEEQSKLAVIGETLTNIEHQWRSPLSKISSNIIALETELEVKGNVEKKSLKKSLQSMTDTLDYMTNLVDYFKVFYMKDQEKKPFLIGNAYLRVSRLLEYDFLKYKINVKYIDDEKLQIYGHLNEFTQVLLNILSNSRDIFIQRDIQNPKIKIVVKKKNDDVIISIEDNAGGIEEGSLENVFEQFFSDKDKQGTGVGLYLCKHIVERKMGGTIRVENNNQGAKFIIKL